jgi:hypothetical protein
VTLQDPVRRDQDLVLAEVGPVLGDVRLPVVHLPHVGVQRTALGEGLAARLAKQVPGRLQAWKMQDIYIYIPSKPLGSGVTLQYLCDQIFSLIMTL